MKLQQMCFKTQSFDREDAGWYACNSVSVRDIRPHWRIAGGGVCVDSLTQSLNECFNRCIANAEDRIRNAEEHIKKLRAAHESYLMQDCIK